MGIFSFGKKSIKDLTDKFSKPGRVETLLIRPVKKEEVELRDFVIAIEGEGLKGDHYASTGGKRQVTLVSKEHIEAVASMLGREVSPSQLRRNVVISGINPHALRDKQFRVGEAILEFTADCHPCSRMEENLGEGGYNAMRGHGGVTARIIKSGKIQVGDEIKPLR